MTIPLMIMIIIMMMIIIIIIDYFGFFGTFWSEPSYYFISGPSTFHLSPSPSAPPPDLGNQDFSKSSATKAQGSVVPSNFSKNTLQVDYL